MKQRLIKAKNPGTLLKMNPPKVKKPATLLKPKAFSFIRNYLPLKYNDKPFLEGLNHVGKVLVQLGDHITTTKTFTTKHVGK